MRDEQQMLKMVNNIEIGEIKIGGKEGMIFASTLIDTCI